MCGFGASATAVVTSPSAIAHANTSGVNAIPGNFRSVSESAEQNMVLAWMAFLVPLGAAKAPSRLPSVSVRDSGNGLPAVPSVPLWVPKGLPPVSLPLSGLGTAFGWGDPAQNATHDAVLQYLQVCS